MKTKSACIAQFPLLDQQIFKVLGVYISLQILDGVRAKVLSKMDILHTLADNIALLDMLCSFATVAVSSDAQYVRPQCTEDGPIAIVNGRHPLLDAQKETEYQPNDSYIADSSSFHIISGPNMSGKTTYLRQAGDNTPPPFPFSVLSASCVRALFCARLSLQVLSFVETLTGKNARRFVCVWWWWGGSMEISCCPP